jgi:hypothetical protein
MKVLVKSGKIGTPVAIQLAKEGHEVSRGIVNRSDSISREFRMACLGRSQQQQHRQVRGFQAINLPADDLRDMKGDGCEKCWIGQGRASPYGTDTPTA